MNSSQKLSENYFQYQKRLAGYPERLHKHQRFIVIYFICFILFPIFSAISLVLHLYLSISTPILYSNWSKTVDEFNSTLNTIDKNPPQLRIWFETANLILNISGIVDILLLLFLMFILITFLVDKVTPFTKISNTFSWFLFIDFLFLAVSIFLTYFLIWILNNNYNPKLDNWALDTSNDLQLTTKAVIINISIILVLSTIFVNFTFVFFAWFLFSNNFYSISWKLINIIKLVRWETSYGYAHSTFAKNQDLNLIRDHKNFNELQNYEVDNEISENSTLSAKQLVFNDFENNDINQKITNKLFEDLNVTKNQEIFNSFDSEASNNNFKYKESSDMKNNKSFDVIDTHGNNNELFISKDDEALTKDIEDLIINYDSKNNQIMDHDNLENYSSFMKGEPNSINQNDEYHNQELNQKSTASDEIISSSSIIERIIKYSKNHDPYLKALLRYKKTDDYYLIEAFKVLWHDSTNRWVEISNKNLNDECYSLLEIRYYFDKLINIFLSQDDDSLNS